MTLDHLKTYSIDLAEQFGAQTASLTDIFNKRAVDKGTIIVGYRAVGELNENMKHAAGAVISDSDIQLEEVELGKLTFDATKVKTSYQLIQELGEELAVDKKDRRLLQLIDEHIETSLINSLVEKAGDKTLQADSYKSVLAKAKGRVKSKQGFKGAPVIAIVNTEDYFDYLSDAPLTTQTMFGMEYIEGFLGYSRIFFTDKVEKGKVVVTAKENLNLDHINVTAAAFSTLGLTASSNGLVGFKHYLDDDTGDIKTKVHFGIKGYAERVDAVVVASLVDPEPAGE